MRMNQDERRFDFHGLGLALKQAREEKGWTQAYVAELVDHDERAGGHGGEQRVELGLPVADGGAGQHLPVAVDQAGPVGGLADV